MSIFIGAEVITSGLGLSVAQNFEALQNNVSGIRQFKSKGFKGEDVFLAASNTTEKDIFEFLWQTAFRILTTKQLTRNILQDDRTLVIISTTKGNMRYGYRDAMLQPAQLTKAEFKLKHLPMVISNACASGVIAINTAADLIAAGKFDHVIVLGIDVISDFVLYGFQSLFAISDEPCKPYDCNRKGITLGEGAAIVVLSNDKTVYTETPVKYMGGSSSNDANHISGPSRTGEGLYRSVKKTLQLSGVKETDIDFISAHGTATIFNDEMEAIAFNRLNMQHIPLNSFKGYYGHTLGAAGVIETALSIQCMRNNTLIKNLGFDEQGTTVPVNVITENIETKVNTILKTASGFGGCNASLILTKA